MGWRQTLLALPTSQALRAFFMAGGWTIHFQKRYILFETQNVLSFSRDPDLSFTCTLILILRLSSQREWRHSGSQPICSQPSQENCLQVKRYFAQGMPTVLGGIECGPHGPTSHVVHTLSLSSECEWNRGHGPEQQDAAGCMK